MRKDQLMRTAVFWCLSLALIISLGAVGVG